MVALFAVLFLSAAYLFAFPAPTLFYTAVVFLHVILGAAAALLLVPFLIRNFKQWNVYARVGWALSGIAAAIGVVLIFIGTTRPHLNWMYAHIVLALAGIAVLAGTWGDRNTAALARTAAAAVLLAALSAGAWYARTTPWQRSHRIQNPHLPPVTMDGEGDGPQGMFFPSSAQSADGKKIPPNYFMESQACERCHQDIYNQWKSSVHHFSSFNNQWYRASIEYMQDVVGTRPSKWCGGCHDPSILFSGMMDTPIRQIVHTPEAQAGMGCMMCHSMTQVKSTMGQGDFTLEYPRLHELAASKNPIVRTLHDFATYLNPEPHRRQFLKPFMRTQTAEFCSSCHKVHLDVPVNHYRWIRGFNEYDNWQASGVSGQGARSFYYPPKPQQCADCHMPEVKSADQGSINGVVHSHRFPGANTAVPFANHDQEQLALTEKFLQGSVTVDIFALSPEPAKTGAAVATQPDVNTTFAVGEEAETKLAAISENQAAPVTAPLNRAHASVRRGDDVRVDVVARTRRVGHFFPGGTIDAYDTWLELKATDDRGQTLFWSGSVEDSGKGPVDKGAHFYRSLLVDAHDNPINKRNAWAARSVVYVRLIPPGAADTVHYRLHIPDSAGDHIKLHARMCYRKFAWWNTNFSFAARPDPAQKDAKVAPEYDDRKFLFNGDTSQVSGEIKAVPDLPIIALSEDEVTVAVLPKNAPKPDPKAVLQADDWTRWNDYGIGLFLQGDLKGAQAAFQKITEMAPNNPDGWVNLGRVAVQEGDMQRARQVLEKALAINPDLARANFFYAKVLKNDGRYADAAQRLHTVLRQYPRDRVALNDLGRLMFLQRQYKDAVATLQNVLDIDPEDLQAHYNLMLCYQGLGDDNLAQQHQKLYLRFKADEAAQAVNGPYRITHPEDNNERQPIHEHVSAPLGAPSHSPASRVTAAAQPRSVTGQ